MPLAIAGIAFKIVEIMKVRNKRERERERVVKSGRKGLRGSSESNQSVGKWWV